MFEEGLILLFLFKNSGNMHITTKDTNENILCACYTNFLYELNTYLFLNMS